jgi:PAS domain S-box-containing protein
MSSTDHLSELESLRSQVADLTHQLAERDCLAQDLREQSNLLRTIVNGTATETGEEFFTTLVTQLTSLLHIQYAVIGEVQGDHTKKIRTLAVSAGDAIVDNFEYELTHTPCATALAQSCACFNQNVRETFPQFQRLADLGAESYCAVSIRAKDGAVKGLLIVMDTKPLENSDYVQALLAVFAPRVAAEFERKRAEQERTRALADLHNVIEAIPDIVFALNTQGNMVKWNRRVVEVTGYSPEELLNKPALAFVPPEEQTHTATAIQRAFTEGYAELEGHLLTKDHRLIPYHWTGAVLKNSDSESIGITGVGRDVSGKNQAEAALRASEERYRALYDDTPTMYFKLATDGTVRSVNRFGAEQLGYRVEELIGHSVLNLFHESDKEAVVSSLSECLANPEETKHWAFRKVRKDGSIVWVRETVRVGQSSTGETVVLVTCEDITERRQVEEALQASQEKLWQALKASNIGLWDWNTDTNEVSFSREWKRQIGYEEADLANAFATWETHLHPDDHDRAIAYVQGYLANPIGEYQQEFRLRHKDETYRWIEARASFVTEPDGRLVRLLGSHTDITDRKQADDALKASERQLRNIIDSMFAFVGIISTDGILLEANKAPLEATGLTRAEIIGRPFADIYSWSYSPVIQAELKAALSRAAQGETVRYDVTVQVRNEQLKTMDMVLVPLADAQGRVTQIIGSAVDITERKRAEEALRLAKFSMERAADAVYWIDPQAKILDVNEAASLMLGYSKDELCVMTVHDLNPDFPAAMWPGFWAETQRRGTMVIETAHRAKNGRLIPIEVAVNYLFYEGKEYHCAFARDITERKQAEGLLQRSEERFRTMFSQAPMGIALINSRTGQIHEVNAAYVHIAGRTREELCSRDWMSISHQDDVQMDLDNMARLVTGAIAGYQMEKRLVLPDGTIRWIHLTVASIRVETYTDPYHLAMMQDITERRQTESALKQSEERLRSLMMNSPSLVFFKALDGRYLYVNRQFERLFQLPEGHIIGKTDYEVFSYEQASQFVANDQRVLQETHAIETEETAHYDDGIHTNLVMKFPVRGADGAAWGIGGIVSDITLRKRAEEELQRAYAERERISQDLHDGILQSLFAVGLALEVSKSRMPPSVRKTSGASLDQAIDQLNRVMREIRNFIAGLDSDLLEGKDLPAAIQHTLAMLTEYQPTHVRLAVENRAAKAVSVEQAQHLLLVIQEAVSNCIRHGRAQEARVSLKMLKQGIRLSIRDNGRGFDQTDVKKTGHGLRNMASRAKKIGGKLSVLSKVNEGTRIVFDLPKERSDASR